MFMYYNMEFNSGIENNAIGYNKAAARGCLFHIFNNAQLRPQCAVPNSKLSEPVFYFKKTERYKLTQFSPNNRGGQLLIDTTLEQAPLEAKLYFVLFHSLIFYSHCLEGSFLNKVGATRGRHKTKNG